MYARFFGLKHEPFSIAPDPRYLYMSERHREALAHLLYGVRSGGGFVLLTGEIGAGKTTVCRCFLEKIPKRCNVAYIFNPKLTVPELLRSVCDEFGVQVHQAEGGEPSVKDYVDALNEFLLRTHAVGQNNVLIIDEAQNLAPDVLEQLRLLTNLETSERKLLQIILIGQPELRTMLARPELEQLAQRVIARFHLDALTEDETARYVRHRLAVAGMPNEMPFDGEALRRVHRWSRGVPRRVNLVCDRAMLGAYATGKKRITREIVDRAAAEVFGDDHLGARARQRWRWAGAAVLGLAAFGGVGFAVQHAWQPKGRVSTPALAPPAPAAPAASAASQPVASPASGPAATSPGGEVDERRLWEQAWRDEDEAWRQLAAAWSAPEVRGAPCEAWPAVQLQCFRSARTSLTLIRLLGRPGILTLRDAQRGSVYALLTALDEHSARLRTAAGPVVVPLASLAAWWQGEFSTLWRSPPGYEGKPLDLNEESAAQWLAERLQQVSPASAPQASLRSRIQGFQLAQGLEPDGRPGPVTLMQLNRATGVDEPRLEN
ncbi:MAG TPA: AAA family ATPase [Burkholderiaceae bacterium]|nr:AAA family ATPase [Burkholderiaceae bacterium]